MNVFVERKANEEKEIYEDILGKEILSQNVTLFIVESFQMYKPKCLNIYVYIYIYILKYNNPKNIYMHMNTLKNVALKSLRLIDVNFK